MVPRGIGAAPLRRFFLARRPRAGEAPELGPGEAEHALRVLRVGLGDRLIGLDGEGGAWPLEVRGVTRRDLDLVCTGDPTLEPRPGEPGAALPWIEVALSWPRGARAESMLDRLTQLGAAAIAPLLSARASVESRRGGAARLERLQRIAIEACKQSGRTWMPRIEAERSVSAWLAGRSAATILVLDPGAELRLSYWLGDVGPGRSARWTAEAPLVLVAGPEGGFSDEEQATFARHVATAVWLHPHILRVETAVEAALAIASEALAR